MSILPSSVSIQFGVESGNCSEYVREGWSGPERTFRWTSGNKSILVLPPVVEAPQYLLTCCFMPFRPPGRERQDLGIEVNGVMVDRYKAAAGDIGAFVVSGGLFSAENENVITLWNYDATVPSEVIPGHTDHRCLGFAWESLTLSFFADSIFVRAGLLPEVCCHGMRRSTCATLFQSLGLSCEFGFFQRRCSVEPLGLLRFAWIFPSKLMYGLLHRFERIDDPAMLVLKAISKSEDLQGHHSIYGLAYHTFVLEKDVDVVQMTKKEVRRIGFLARMLMEQLEGNEKIFVRRGGFSTLSQLRALHFAMHLYNSEARLLYVEVAPVDAPELVGRVEWLGPGLYKGYLDRFSPVADANDLSFEV